MKKSYSLLFFILLLGLPTNAQENKILESLYSAYFENTREIPFLHLNKTSFLKEEEIWFQAYILEQNSNKLHPTTSNLYVSIFDDEGKLKDQHLVHIKNGIGRGNILIDSTFTKNSYYLKASTNWMKNFKEDNAFVQKIKIITNQQKEKNITLTEKDFFDFQLFPEGGHIIANAMNTIGILIKDSENKGLKVLKGEIKNEYGIKISTFSTNEMGFGKITLPFKENKIYTFEAYLDNGSVIKEKTTIPKAKGITIKTENLNNLFVLNIITNKRTIEELAFKKYRVLLHNTRKYANTFFTFNKAKTNYKLKLNKKDIAKGINIITVFNENDDPVLERLIYNETKNLFDKNLKIETLKQSEDSIILRISNTSNEKIFISSSFLPSKTKAYNPKHNIKSSILLKPYIKGEIEDAQYYFQNTKKRIEDLDLLLLTQGWSKYDWFNIFKSPTTTNFNFENGINITGKFNQPIKQKQNVLIFSADNNIIKEVKPINNTFVLKNTFIKKNSNIEFTSKGETKLYKIAPALSFSKSSLNETFNVDIKDKKENIELEISNFKNYFNNVTILNEVVVKAKKNYDNKVTGIGSSYRFREGRDLRLTGSTLTDYILAFAREKSYSKRPLAGVFLNNKRITRFNLPFNDIDLAEVRGVAYGNAPIGNGTLLYIYSYSKAEIRELRINTKLSETMLKVGFTTEKEFYEPKYISFSSETYTGYGALFWKPTLEIEANSNIKFSIPKNYQEEFRVFIEGISESGKLLSISNIITN